MLLKPIPPISSTSKVGQRIHLEHHSLFMGECRYPSGKEVRIRDRSGKQVLKQPVGYRCILLQQPCKGPDTLHTATFHIRRKECVDECGRGSQPRLGYINQCHSILTRDFRWDLTANYGVYKNKVVKLADGVPYLEILNSGGSGIKIQAVEGQPMGDIYAQVPQVNENGEYLVSDKGFTSTKPNCRKSATSIRQA